MRRLWVVVLILFFALPLGAQEKEITGKTAGLQKIEGYFPLYWDAANGKMLMEISHFDKDVLLQISLPAGVGSNPIGLDRGQLGGTHVVRFKRIGPKVLMIQPNYRFRAITDNVAEERAVEDSFARSVLWGFKVEAADGDDVLVDATSFFLRDGHGVIARLQEAKQGHYRLDESRSAFYLSRTKGFPKNTEVEVMLTFTTDDPPGRLIRETTPDAKAVTVREHYALVELPDLAHDGYKPRRLDPRVGNFAIAFYDYGSNYMAPLEKQWIERFRLEKKDPNAAVSEPVKPIVYYVDNGAPEPIRGALIEGASWWNAAFEAAGFKNAFQVKVLPADADPMDLRYNVINWVQRSTRGWSYGESVVDPRTGEILKGDVTLDSLRIRQDYLIGSGLTPQYRGSRDGAFLRGADGVDGAVCTYADFPGIDDLADLDPTANAAALALARIRQLAAHEVGHTIGLAHNFAGSTYGRASVMDYPAPTIGIKNGKLDFSKAYAVGIGAYDKFAIRYAYSEFSPGADENKELNKMVSAGVAAGMLFLTDEDARPAGAADPRDNLWDNGNDPVAMLKHEMEVRRIGIENFGLHNISDGTPLAMLEAKFLPLYLHHRYQLSAAIKSVGGLYYTYSVKTPEGPNPPQVQEIVPAAQQRAALNAALETLSVGELMIPRRILKLIPPPAFGYRDRNTELFAKRTEPAFDPIAAATIDADLVVSGLLQPQRDARVVEFHALDTANPSLKEVIDALMAHTWKAPKPSDEYGATILRAVQTLTVKRLMELAGNANASSAVRDMAAESLRELGVSLKAPTNGDAMEVAHRRATRDNIERFLNRPAVPFKTTEPPATPPGDPIGAGGYQGR